MIALNLSKKVNQLSGPLCSWSYGSRCVHDSMIVVFTTIYAISVYHHWLWIPLMARLYTLCDKVCQLLAADQWFSQNTLVFSTKKTDHRNVTEILLIVALNTLTLNQLPNILPLKFCHMKYRSFIFKMASCIFLVKKKFNLFVFLILCTIVECIILRFVNEQLNVCK